MRDDFFKINQQTFIDNFQPITFEVVKLYTLVDQSWEIYGAPTMRYNLTIQNSMKDFKAFEQKQEFGIKIISKLAQ